MLNKDAIGTIVINSIKFGRALVLDKLSVIHKCRAKLADEGVHTRADQRRRAVTDERFDYLCVLMDGCGIYSVNVIEDRTNQYWCVWTTIFGRITGNWEVSEFQGYIRFDELMEKH